jgi:hypothetical protein
MHTEQNPKIPSTEQTQTLTLSRSQGWDAMNKPKRHISLRSPCFQKLKPSRLPFEAKDQEKHTHTPLWDVHRERHTVSNSSCHPSANSIAAEQPQQTALAAEGAGTFDTGWLESRKTGREVKSYTSPCVSCEEHTRAESSRAA